MDLSQLTPRRPYLLRAFYEWLLDNQLTPHLVVDVTLPGVQVPMEYARDGQIVLNIAPRAVGNLELANDEVSQITMMTLILTMNLRSHHAVVDRHYALLSNTKQALVACFVF